MFPARVYIGPNADWEKLSTFLNFLIPKLPAPQEEDLSKRLPESRRACIWASTH